jgi:hypothetical protein
MSTADLLKVWAITAKYELTDMPTSHILTLRSILAKYSEDQLRDYHGRFSSEGGGEGQPKDTMSKYMHGGIWDKSRVDHVHARALATYFDGVRKAPSDRAPRVYCTGGGYGSGKSTMVRSGVAGVPRHR